jgi:hypothetical protein
MATAYLDRTCVLRVEVNNRLSAAGNLDLVLWAEPRHDCIVPPSVFRSLLLCTGSLAAHL